MKYILISLLAILLITLVLYFSIISNFLQFYFWRLTTADNSQSGYVQRQKTQLHYRIYGKRNSYSGSQNKSNPVVLLHGGLSTKLSWFSQVPSLVKSGYEVILIDTRGHGKSSHSAEHRYELYAADVVKILDTLKINTVDILGWSDGGNTGLILGYQYPERVDKIIAISANIFPEGLTEETQNEIKTPNSWLKQIVNRFWTKAEDNYPKLEEKVQKLWRTEPQMTSQMLLKINHPILLIQGENDSITIEHAKKIEQYLPDAELKLIVGAGHATPVTNAKEINDLILRFLKN